jgi:hypothetical protein
MPDTTRLAEAAGRAHPAGAFATERPPTGLACVETDRGGRLAAFAASHRRDASTHCAKRPLFIANALKRHLVGLEEVADGVWPIHFCHVLLGRVDERDYIIEPNHHLSPMLPVYSVTYLPGSSDLELFKDTF